MVVNTTKDKDRLNAIKKRLSWEVKTLTSWGLSREDALKQVSGTLKGTETFSKIQALRDRVNAPTDTTEVLDTTKTIETKVQDEPIVPTVDEGLTLREKVAQKVSGKKTREELLKAERGIEWRSALVEQGKAFRQETASVQEDLENIRKWLSAEGGAITNIAASRIREARSAPLREQLVSLVKGQALTSASIKELDGSIDAILKARAIDRQEEVSTLTAQIEGSNLTTEQKNELIGQLWVQTKRMQREEENEAFRQKEQIKADIENADKDSLAKTWLTAEQNLQAATIIENFEVKEDSIAGQSIRKLLKEGKTTEQINKILWLAADSTGKINDEQFTRQEKLRKEFEASATVKQYMEATQQFASVVSSLWQATWPGDMAAVFAFMKTLDPSSVVRESEFASAANSSGILDKIQSLQLLKKAETGEILTPRQRTQFVQIAKALFENRKSAFDERAGRFITLAKEAGANPRSVVLDFDNIPWVATDLTEDDLAPIWGNSSDADIVNFLNKSQTFSTFTSENIEDASDDDINALLQGDFKSADQTATPKGKIGSILWDLQNKVTVVEKWWDNKVLWLSGWSLTFRTNNPLAITATSPWQISRIVQRFGAIPDLFSPDSADNLVLNFNTPEEWLAAWVKLLESKWDLSINKLLESHTWTSAIWHKAQARKLWLDLNVKFKDLSQSDKNKVIEAIKIGEWFRPGTINT